MLLAEYRVSERRASATVFLQRSVYRYLDQQRDDRARAATHERDRRDARELRLQRIHILLRCEGWRKNFEFLVRWENKSFQFV